MSDSKNCQKCGRAVTEEQDCFVDCYGAIQFEKKRSSPLKTEKQMREYEAQEILEQASIVEALVEGESLLDTYDSYGLMDTDMQDYGGEG